MDITFVKIDVFNFSFLQLLLAVNIFVKAHS